MKKLLVITLSSFMLLGCVNTHPYKYTLNEKINQHDKSSTIWAVADISNDDGISLSDEKKLHLTDLVIAYLGDNGLNAKPQSQASLIPQGNILTIQPRIINAWAEISQNMAGWHGTKEDPIGFWSHFFSGHVGPYTPGGSIAALSLQIQILSGDTLYFDNAGGIELVAKVHRFAGTKPKSEVLSNDKKFSKAMDIAFKPLLESL